jgi:hypothetical protein
LKTLIGPFPRHRIVLCSADADPGSQKDFPDQAAYFFPGAKWVGAVRNAAERVGCRVVVLTTGHGMVNPEEVIQPYDMHISEYPEEVKRSWLATIPQCLGDNRYDILVFYAGGCPRKPYIEMMLPILQEMNISLLTFGRPSMYDSGKIDELVDAIVLGTTIAELKSILRLPEKLEYYPARKERDNKVTASTRLQDDKRRHDAEARFKILFNDGGKAYDGLLIRGCILNFGTSYNATVRYVIENSEKGLSKQIFFQNVARLMPNFLMTRKGPFKGVRFHEGVVSDPESQIEKCWSEIGDAIVDLRNFVDRENRGTRGRALVEMPSGSQREVVNRLLMIFKRLLPICMGKSTRGLVGASKLLFAVVPEVALPIDTAQWKQVFRTVDYGEITSLMADEITEWEKDTANSLDLCDPSYPATSLPAVYNVMAMKARPQTNQAVNLGDIVS